MAFRTGAGRGWRGCDSDHRHGGDGQPESRDLERPGGNGDPERQPLPGSKPESCGEPETTASGNLVEPGSRIQPRDPAERSRERAEAVAGADL